METVGTGVLVWRDGRLVTDSDPRPWRHRTVADSFLLEDGRALALHAHRERFLRTAHDAEDFWDAAIEALPRAGIWFPRLEQVLTDEGDGELRLLLRPAPELSVSLVLATADRDPRTAPEVKGPDLEALATLRAEAQAAGADEAVLTSPEGYVVEGASTCIVWWRGALLCLPPDDLPRVDGVAERALVTAASALGVEIVCEHVTPAELDGTEVWALNALHGIRIVTGWIDGPATAELPGRLALWRRRLDALRRPLD
ncbi:MAG TPA: aminotransferase class IV [Naasia sp.]|jgi:branched-subunit amino acid aminotransferase/4-amino-4-deoxychorismate lyase